MSGLKLTAEERTQIRRLIDRRRRGVLADKRLAPPTWAQLSRVADDNNRLRRRVETLERIIARGPRQHSNQHGAVTVYETEEERLEARRATWRLSKQRAALRAAE